MSEILDPKLRVKVFRIQGSDKQLLRTFPSKKDTIQFAKERAAIEPPTVIGTLPVRYVIQVPIPEVHLELSNTKRILPLPHKLVTQLIATSIEATHNVSRTYYEKTVGGRRIDVVLENTVDGSTFQIFVEVETKPVKEHYIQQFLKFCSEHNPYRVIIVSPVLKRETRFWTKPRERGKSEMEIIPTKDVFKEVQNYYSVKFDTIGGEVVLLLDPFKEIILKPRVDDESDITDIGES